MAAEGQSLDDPSGTLRRDNGSGLDLLQTLNQRWPDSSFEQLSLSNVSPAMGSAFLRKSLVAVVFALLLILLYIAFRFKKIGGFTGGMMAVLALANDLMVVFGAFVLLRAPLDGNFIAALLTILGYSINDTVVVYDRIRENRTLMDKKTSFAELVIIRWRSRPAVPLLPRSLRSIALAVMCIVAVNYGLDSIVTFAFPLMLGMIERCVYFSVHFQLCLGRLERAQKARAFV